jgi:hypothetical protein
MSRALPERPPPSTARLSLNCDLLVSFISPGLIKSDQKHYLDLRVLVSVNTVGRLSGAGGDGAGPDSAGASEPWARADAGASVVRSRAIARVLVVCMDVRVFMLQCLVSVLVLVPLGQVQP